VYLRRGLAVQSGIVVGRNSHQFDTTSSAFGTPDIVRVWHSHLHTQVDELSRSCHLYGLWHMVVVSS
jgi:hypothetical protein